VKREDSRGVAPYVESKEYTERTKETVLQKLGKFGVLQVLVMAISSAGPVQGNLLGGEMKSGRIYRRKSKNMG